MKLLSYRLSIGAALGLAIVLVNLVAVALAPWIAPHGEADMVGDVWAPPSATAWLGLDNLGRDMLSRLLFGGRTSIALALLITLLAFAIGTTAGFAAAAAPRWVDLVMSRVVDALMAIPQLILTLIVL
ncbi:MAG: ABC transporter permease, partial [Nevskiales bacterium]